MIAAFHEAGKVEEALRVLQQLTNNAIAENRFSDAGYYCWILSLQCVELANGQARDRVDACIAKYSALQRKGEIYYAYHNIHRYIVRLCARWATSNEQRALMNFPFSSASFAPKIFAPSLTNDGITGGAVHVVFPRCSFQHGPLLVSFDNG